MDAALLARIQFATTIGFHFIFAPMGIGLSWLVFALLTKYRRSGDERYRQLAKLWSRVLALTFGIGVATGITMEFQFGTNWAAYSRFVGDIFGAPLAAEVIFTFFLESTFLYVLVFGWDRVSPKVHYVSSFLVALGSTMSAFFILVANSWMQTPTGYVLRNGRAELVSFWGAVFSPSMPPRFLHTVDGALMTGIFFMFGVSALMLLLRRHEDMSRVGLRMSLWLAFIFSVAQLGTGHYSAAMVVRQQPEKLASVEGLFETQRHAPLLIFGLPDPDTRTVKYAVRVPSGLSILAYLNPNAEVKGLNDFPRDEWPPLYLTFFPFHGMFIFGMYLIGVPALGILMMWIGWLDNKRLIGKLYLLLAAVTMPVPILCNELGWMTAECGRQPWIVYHLMKTKDAISVSVPASHILASMIIFGLIYLLLGAVWLLLVAREVARGPGEPAGGSYGGGEPA
jgi:cytochrome d ubiquinol oxidase subunit I